jgi:murein DD-endopeptidase MepM/ murein hydrolase activator NlpD
MGKYVVLRWRHNGDKYEAYYLHNSRVTAKAGRRVKRGETIARSGNTGKSTGPHCHFTLKKNGKVVDPKRYF